MAGGWICCSPGGGATGWAAAGRHVEVQVEVLAHAIWTSAVVSHPVMTDNHHRHSLELVSFEAPVIEIVVVIAHAISWEQSWW